LRFICLFVVSVAICSKAHAIHYQLWWWWDQLWSGDCQSLSWTWHVTLVHNYDLQNGFFWVSNIQYMLFITKRICTHTL